MTRSLGKILFVLLLILIGVGLFFTMGKRSVVLTERVPWGLSVGTEIREGKNYQDLLSWEGEVFTLKEEFEGLLRKIEREPSNFENLSLFLNEQNYYTPYLLHAMLFALEQKENNVYRTRFLSRHFNKLNELKSTLDREPLFLYLLGLKNLQENQPTPALQLFKRAVDLSPPFGKPYGQMAKVYFQQCLYDSVLQVLPYSLSLDPASREFSYSLLIQSLFHLKKTDSLNLALETLPEKYPYSKTLQLTVAQALENQGNLDQAETIYQQLLRLFPNDEILQKSLSQLGNNPFPSCSTPFDGGLIENQNLSASIENLLSAYPQNPWLWLALWESLKESNPKRAAETRRRILEDFPDLGARLPLSETLDAAQEKNKKGINIADDLPDSLASKVLASLDNKRSLDSELGHYLVHWGRSLKEFYSKYDARQFKNFGDSALVQKDSLLGFPTTYYLLFEGGKFEKVIGEFEDPDRRLDVLGRVLRAKSKLSGPPRSSGDMDCPGFKKFQFFIWEGLDHFELVAQFGNKSWQARMLRVPGTFAKDKQICEMAPHLIPPKEVQ